MIVGTLRWPHAGADRAQTLSTRFMTKLFDRLSRIS
jgi:hypothetical protein